MDTQKITQDLLATNLTQQELADLVPCSQSLINAFLNGTRGSRVTKTIGDRLEELHAERCKPPIARRASDPEPTPARQGRQPALPARA